jgi:hypothetical protein
MDYPHGSVSRQINFKKRKSLMANHKIVYKERSDDGAKYSLLSQKLVHWNLELVATSESIILQTDIQEDNKRYMLTATISWSDIHAMMNVLKLLSKCASITQLDYQLDAHRFKLLHPANSSAYDDPIKRWISVWTPGKENDYIPKYRCMAIYREDELVFLLPFHVIREMLPYLKGMYHYFDDGRDGHD